MNTRTFYNMLAPVYPAIDHFLSAHKSKLIKMVNAESPGHLLEIGVGTGSHLSKYCGHVITGIDVSEGMLQRAKIANSGEVKLLLMNGENIDFENDSFDLVILPHVLAVVSSPEKVLDESYRVLKSKGKLFILNHFTPDNPLKWIDKLFAPISKVMHIRSAFYENELDGLQRFNILSNQTCGRLGYFKLLILQKP